MVRVMALSFAFLTDIIVANGAFIANSTNVLLVFTFDAFYSRMDGVVDWFAAHFLQFSADLLLQTPLKLLQLYA